MVKPRPETSHSRYRKSRRRSSRLGSDALSLSTPDMGSSPGDRLDGCPVRYYDGHPDIPCQRNGTRWKVIRFDALIADPAREPEHSHVATLFCLGTMASR